MKNFSCHIVDKTLILQYHLWDSSSHPIDCEAFLVFSIEKSTQEYQVFFDYIFKKFKSSSTLANRNQLVNCLNQGISRAPLNRFKSMWRSLTSRGHIETGCLVFYNRKFVKRKYNKTDFVKSAQVLYELLTSINTSSMEFIQSPINADEIDLFGITRKKIHISLFRQTEIGI